jgi:hypothetical protein
MRLPWWVIFDSPQTTSPSSNFAPNCTSAVVEGTIWPRTASTRLVARTASSKLPPMISVRAAMNRLPKE